mgnify:CR=1 FL=1
MTQISASELEVMDVLWARPGLAASDVHDALGDGRDWSPSGERTTGVFRGGSLSGDKNGGSWVIGYCVRD